MPDSPQCAQPLLLPLNKITCPIPTQHVKGVSYLRWISCLSEIPDFETFQSFRHEKLLGTGTRTVRGWKQIRKLQALSSDWAQILRERQVPSLCMHYNYTFNWGVKGDSAHLSYIPVLYIPASSTVSRREIHRHATASSSSSERICGDHCVCSQCCPTGPAGKKKVHRARKDDTSRIFFRCAHL